MPLHNDFENNKRFAKGCKCLSCTFDRIKVILDLPPIDRTKIFTELDNCVKHSDYDGNDPVVKKLNEMLEKINDLEEYEILGELEKADLEIDYILDKADDEYARVNSWVWTRKG